MLELCHGSPCRRLKNKTILKSIPKCTWRHTVYVCSCLVLNKVKIMQRWLTRVHYEVILKECEEVMKHFLCTCNDKMDNRSQFLNYHTTLENDFGAQGLWDFVVVACSFHFLLCLSSKGHVENEMGSVCIFHWGGNVFFSITGCRYHLS